MPRKHFLIHVAVGIVRNDEGDILIAQRPAHKYCPGLWEFPGGKVEANETVLAALQREFQEEIGIDILSADPWFQIQHDYGDRVVLLDIWFVRKFQGIPRGAEGQIIQWIKSHQFTQYEFPSGNQEIIEKLMQK